MSDPHYTGLEQAMSSLAQELGSDALYAQLHLSRACEATGAERARCHLTAAVRYARRLRRAAERIESAAGRVDPKAVEAFTVIQGGAA